MLTYEDDASELFLSFLSTGPKTRTSRSFEYDVSSRSYIDVRAKQLEQLHADRAESSLEVLLASSCCLSKSASRCHDSFPL